MREFDKPHDPCSKSCKTKVEEGQKDDERELIMSYDNLPNNR